MEKSWTFTDLWNQSVLSENRELKERDYCWASEIGGPMIDRYLKMKAVPYTNPPNIRSLRKFEAGNVMEWIVRFVLTRAGIIREFQEEVWVEYDGLLKVKGKLDFLAGGFLDADRATADISQLGLPQSIRDSSMYMVKKLSEVYEGKALKTMVLEIKSCSSFVMDMMEVTEKPIKNHVHQLFHYVKGLDLDEGHLAYICRDDMRMMEFPVFNPSGAEANYISDLMQITEYVRSNTMPPKENNVMWDQDQGKFKKNLGIEYSPYLTKIYGFETPRNYSDAVSPIVARWNRVLTRYAKGETITKKNEEVKSEIKTSGYDFDELVYTKRNIGIFEEEESI